MAPSDQDIRDQIVEHLPLIDRIVASTARRHGLTADEKEELSSMVRLRLLENDGAALRNFRGDSSLATYLSVVVRRLIVDWRRARWGKKRPSAAAREAGLAGILLERLIHWQGFSFDEACRLLRDNHGLDESRDELERIAATLPPPSDRLFEDDSVLDTPAGLDHAEPRSDPEDEALERERQAQLRRLAGQVDEVLDDLEPQDRVMLRLRFIDGLPPRAIARSLQIDVQVVYRGVERLPAKIRTALDRRGVDRSVILDVLRRGPGAP